LQDGFPPAEVFDGAWVLMALTKPRKFGNKVLTDPCFWSFQVLT
jgi:hypothetical protein